MKRLFGISAVAVMLGIASSTNARAVETERNAGAVFVMTNSAEGNQVLAYARAADGNLEQRFKYYTGGRGSGGLIDPLESQGSLTLSEDHSLLFAVNAGSGTLAVFRVHGPRLFLIDVVHSGGSEPNAVAQRGDLVYVLNTGGSSGVTGFRLREGGRLERIANSQRFLSTNTSGAASLSFSPDGRFLVVSERLTNSIDTFKVQEDGTLSPIVLNHDAAPGTFSVAFAPNGTALVTETGPEGVQNGSTISSYGVQEDGTLFPISIEVPTLGAATCWHVVTPDGRFVYTDNAGTSNISGFFLNGDGTLTPLPHTIQAANPDGSTNLDMAITANGKFLYTLNARTGRIGIFAVNESGALANIGSVNAVDPMAGANGIATF